MANRDRGSRRGQRCFALRRITVGLSILHLNCEEEKQEAIYTDEGWDNHVCMKRKDWILKHDGTEFKRLEDKRCDPRAEG